MKLRVLVSILCLSGASIINAAEPAKLTEEDFLSKYQPDKNKCRPGLIAGEDGKPQQNPDFLLKSIEGSIACMLKGEKHVYWIQPGQGSYFERLFSDLKELKDLLAAKNFAYFKIGRSVFIFSPVGRQYALLFGKSEKTDTSMKDTYFIGHLLGYSDEDIKAFHTKIGGSEKVWVDRKAQTQKWIQDNKDGIEAWAAKHLKIHSFEKSQCDAQTTTAAQVKTDVDIKK